MISWIRISLYILCLGLISGCAKDKVDFRWLKSVNVDYASPLYEIDGMNTWVEVEVVNKRQDTVFLADFVGNDYPMPSFIKSPLSSDSLAVHGPLKQWYKYVYVAPYKRDTFKITVLGFKNGHYSRFIIPEPVKEIEEQSLDHFFIDGILMIRKSISDKPIRVPKSKNYHFKKIE